MRPIPPAGTGLSGRSLRGDDATTPSSSAVQPISCFLTTESQIDSASDDASSAYRQDSLSHKRNAESVQARRTDQAPKHDGFNVNVSAPSSSPRLSSSSESDSASVGPVLSSAKAFAQAVQERLDPLTPLSAPLSGPISMMSSSRRSSLTVSSLDFQASSGDASASAQQPLPAAGADLASSSAAQLIMPSLTIPRRRPFTEKGKSIGKLKLLVAGEKGVGKTSLIQSLMQTCEDIVHMDPAAPEKHGHVLEISASTRAFPWWQTRLDQGSKLGNSRRRPSSDEVLDRNLCFVDCPRYKNMPQHSQVDIDYVEHHLRSLLHRTVDEKDLGSLVSSGAEPVVDAVIYMLPHTGPSADDITHLKALQSMTNVIVVMSRADEVDTQLISEAKSLIEQTLHHHEIGPFSFSMPGATEENSAIFAVSNATYTDHDVIDASVLMSSEYISPLVPTDLSKLVDSLFTPDGSSWLRHSAAEKAVQWRRRQSSASNQLMISHRQSLTNVSLSPVLTVNPFARHRYWERVELSNWADDLRRSLEAEQLVQPSSILRLTDSPPDNLAETTVVRKAGERSASRRRKLRRREITQQQDPLGLLRIANRLNSNTRSSNVELVGSVGAVCCLAVWLLRPEQVGHQELSFIERCTMAIAC